MSGFSEHIVTRLDSARRIAVLTGAGASAESGIPTFRDPDGLWSKFDPAELATVDAFNRDPVRVQAWYSARLKAVRAVDPNPCHIALAALERLVDSVTIVTQNVDGLHQRAGSTDVVELHGNLTNIFCVSCGASADQFDVTVDATEPVRCGCGGLLRPGVVWFGEMMPETALEAAFVAAIEADVFLSVGTAAAVYPAGGLPLLAAESGAYVLEINLNRTIISDRVTESARGPAGVLTPLLLELMTRHRPFAAG